MNTVNYPNNKVDLVDLNVLDFDIDLAVAMKAMFENLLFIRYKFIIENYFRKLMVLFYHNFPSEIGYSILFCLQVGSISKDWNGVLKAWRHNEKFWFQ